MRERNGRKVLHGALGFVLAAVIAGGLVGCSHDADTPRPALLASTLVREAQTAPNDWDADARLVTVTLMEGTGPSGTVYSYSPANITFEALRPVTLTIVNPAANTEEHEYHADEFFETVAWRKVQTADAEYKAPYFEGIELLTPTGSDKIVELYFIPVVPGTYDVHCMVGTHAIDGMEGLITVTGPANTIDQEVSATWNPALENDIRTGGGHPVWTRPAASTFGQSTVALAAADLVTDWNTGADSGDPRMAGITASDGGGGLVILTADVAGVPFSVAPSVDGGGAGTIGSFTTTTSALHADEAGGAVAQESEMQITVSDYDAATTYTLTVDATVIDMVEIGGTPISYRFMAQDLTLTNGLGYILRITNLDPTNPNEHYYTMPEFYETCVTRKAEDSQAEIEAPYFKTIEVLIGGTTELYLVPTVDSPGGIPYDVICTVGTHEVDGLEGTIDVQ